MTEVTLKTSEGDEFIITIDASGNGYLHAHPEGLGDKVRIKGWELDNHDELFVVDYHLENEWDDLIAAYIERVEREWANREDVTHRLEDLRVMRRSIQELDRQHRADRKEKVREFRLAFKDLLRERLALPQEGSSTMVDTRYDCCRSYEVQRIVIGDQVLIEDID